MMPLLALLSLSFLAAALPREGPPAVPSTGDLLLKRQFDEYSERFLQPSDFHLAALTPVDRPTPQQLDAVQNYLLFEGDIVGIPVDGQRLRDEPLHDNDEQRIFGRPYYSSLNLATYPDKLWTEGRVPYELEEGMTKEQRAAIAQAFDEYKEKTCIRFVPREDDDADFIYLKRNVAFGCSSYVGRAGGNQTVSLEVDKCFSKGIIAHELMHSIGFFHEHSRTDRDQFVSIQDDNIRPGMMRNFEKYPKKIIDPLGMPYDYESVMHYHKLAFSKNGHATIVPKKKEVEIGQRYRLSAIDAAKVNKLYKCEDDEETNEETTTAVTKTTTKKTKTTKKGRLSTRWPARKTTTAPPTTTEEEEEEEEVEEETTTAPSTITTTKAPADKKKCVDLNAHCEMWEQLGHCQHSLKYMAHYCRKSCKLCGEEGNLLEKTTPSTTPKRKSTTTASTTTTTTRSPPTSRPPKSLPSIFGTLLTTTERTTKATTESTTPEATTGQAKKCADKNLFCSYWARIGECASESKFMRIFCKKSCGRCEDE